jgi:beta-lactamase class A
MHRLFILGMIVLMLAACGPRSPELPPTAGPSPTPQPAGSPGAAPTETPAVPTASTTPPTPSAVPPTPRAAAPHAAIIYQLTSDGSIQLLDPASGAGLALADPTQPEQRLPWSYAPNGQTIAVVTGRWDDRSGTVERASLWTVDVNGSNPRKLLDLVPASIAQPLADLQLTLTGEQFQTLAWTPDGVTIVVASAHEGQADLYAIAADGSTVRRLTETPDLEFQAAIAPDGSAVAYGSAASFGTGAGWSDPGAWMQPLSGGERSTIVVQEPDAATAATEIAGWSGQHAVALSYDNVQNAATLWAAAANSEPIKLNQSAGTIFWDLSQNTLAFVAGQQQGQSMQSVLWSWRGGDTAATQLSAVADVTQIALSPSGNAIALCSGVTTQSLKLWDGALRELGAGACERLVWSDGAQIAVGGATSDAAARIVETTTAQAEPLPGGAIPIGWNGPTFYFFTPLADNSGWQLQARSDSQDTPIGTPVAGLPSNPRLISSATPLPPAPTSTPVPTAVPQPTAAPTDQPTPAPTAPPSAGLEQLRERLAALIDGWAGEHAVSVTDLQSGATISVNGARPQLAACTIKIVLMMAVAQDIEAGRYSEADVASLVRSAMGPSNTAPARELLQIVGDGEIGAGIRRVNEIMWSLGATKSILTHPPGYYWEEYGYADSHGTSENRVTSDDLNLILSKLYRGEALSTWATEYVLASLTIAPDWMDHALGSPLPAGTRLYHKIGQLYEPENTWNDAGIVVFERGGQQRAYVISYLGSYGATWQDSYAHATSLSDATWRYFGAAYQ